jgi:hypothetical protein
MQTDNSVSKLDAVNDTHVICVKRAMFPSPILDEMFGFDNDKFETRYRVCMCLFHARGVAKHLKQTAATRV